MAKETWLKIFIFSLCSPQSAFVGDKKIEKHPLNE